VQVSDLLDGCDFPHLHADQSLHMALERMGEAGLDLLPVVSRADLHTLEGIVLLRDVLDSYRIGVEGNY
jgi:CBS domain-containing protein